MYLIVTFLQHSHQKLTKKAITGFINSMITPITPVFNNQYRRSASARKELHRQNFCGIATTQMQKTACNGINSVDWFKGLKEFTPEDYRKLSFEAKEKIRSVFPIGEYTADTRNNVITLGKAVKSSLDKRFPQGCTFAPIGRSLYLMGKFLEFAGYDVKYCPISGLKGAASKEFSPEFVSEYGKYLEKTGLTKPPEKPVIFTDYLCYGGTFKNFQKLIAKPEINIHTGDNIHFLPLAVYKESRFCPNSDTLLSRNDLNDDRSLLRCAFEDIVAQYSKRRHYLGNQYLPHTATPEEMQKVFNAPQSEDFKKLLFYLAERMDVLGLLK